ncbi:MAG: uracil-DNA glycosylase [Bacilli bacterium]
MNEEEIRSFLSSFPDGWDELLKDEKNKTYYQNLLLSVSEKYLTEKVYPPYEKVFSAFSYTSVDDIKCVIIGQDPYFNEGQANGLAFSVNKGVRLPPSLLNIYKELFNEYSYPIPKNGSLESWARQGVLLLNSSLTVKEGEPNSHSKLGWETFTDDVIKIIDSLDRPIVYLLCGNYAFKKSSLIKSRKAFIIHTAHPSPLSASRGFFDSNCFKRCNEYLIKNDIEPIDFQIKD